MKILQVSFADVNGGAEQVAWDLHQAYLQMGHQSLLVVGRKRSQGQDNVVGLVPERFSHAWFPYQLIVELERRSGIQAMGYWMFKQWWGNSHKRWDIVHFHNVHSSYFDLGVLPEIARTIPIVQTLHDCWQFTGHCASPKECQRWRAGCGDCPNLSAYPAIQADRTRFNWHRKQRIYLRAKPVLVTPSEWLRSLVQQSLLKHLRCELIHNGVDIQRFRQSDRRGVQQKLGLPVEKKVLLYVANGGLKVALNRDPELALNSLRRLVVDSGRSDVILVAVGGQAGLPQDLAPHVIQRDFLRDGVESYYQAADVYLHPTRADNFSLAILEAMACGLPVVTTDVGGCGEQVLDGQTGYVVSMGDVEAFAKATARLLDGESETMGKKAAERAKAEFSLSKMAVNYLALYQELIAEA
ncbi:MAG: glycosyltransferase [Ardenticatenaceae bacterium]|nr:glycosyltransferase [Ardenticatenaceae bacterium]